MKPPYTAALALLLTVASLAPLAAAQAPIRETRGTLVLDGVPPHSPRVLATLDGWLAGRSAVFQDFIPDGGILISTRFADSEQVHRVASPGAAREQLTFDAEPTSNPERTGRNL